MSTSVKYHGEAAARQSIPLTVMATEAPAVHRAPASGGKSLHLSAIKAGESARILRVKMSDSGCRRRFAEIGLYEGMTVRVMAASDTMILAIGDARMAISAHCAASVLVARVDG